MLTETGDRDAIVANAIDIASARRGRRTSPRACGNDPALMRQVEELVAAHFQAGSAEQPAVAAIPGSRSRGRDLEKTSGSVADNREASEQRRGDMQRYFDIETVEASKMNQKKPRGLVTIGALLVLVASAVGAAASLAVWKINQGPLQQDLDRAKHEASEARKIEAELKQQRDQALAAQKPQKGSAGSKRWPPRGRRKPRPKTPRPFSISFKITCSQWLIPWDGGTMSRRKM